MQSRNLGINADCLLGENSVETLSLIKKQGFSCFFTAETDLQKLRALKAEGDRLGLTFEFIHSPFHGMNDFWLKDNSCQALYDGILQTIDNAALCGVKTVIVHVSNGWTPPPVNDIGLARFDTIVNRAKEKGVIIAFENLRKLGNFACIMERYEREENVKFCYDVGHEHCYTCTVPFVDIYADRLHCTHIHDNFGKSKEAEHDDLHLLPFDGNIDYAKIKHKLDECGYQGSLMLEVFNHGDYAKLTKEEFIQTAFERIQKISKL